MTRTGTRIMPKYRDETLDQYDARVKRTMELRAKEAKKFLKFSVVAEPAESLLDAAERKFGENGNERRISLLARSAGGQQS